MGYLDQHSALEPGKTIRETLRTAFQDLVEQEQEMLGDYDKMESASPEEMERLMEEVGEIQERLEAADYYNLDAKIEEVAGGLGLRDIGNWITVGPYFLEPSQYLVIWIFIRSYSSPRSNCT